MSAPDTATARTKRQSLSDTGEPVSGAVLARRLGGERALPTVDGRVVLSRERLCRHVLVCGATGSGKSETVLRLAWAVAGGSDAAVFYLDAKGDRAAAERFVGLMADAGRQARVFPYEPIDGWRGEAHDLQDRLIEVVAHTREGPAAWYRDLAKVVLRLACEHPDGPPRSSRELLSRLDRDALRHAHGATVELEALNETQVGQVRLRYAAFFGATRGALDGAWAWEDADAGYLLLDSLRLREETACLARWLLEDFGHYFSARRPPGRWTLLVVDELSALAGAVRIAQLVEQARGFDTALVLAPQVAAGMGDSSEQARILGSVETVVCHRVNTPEEIVALAGTRQAPRHTVRYTHAGATGEGSLQRTAERRIDPNRVRALAPGEAFLISHGRTLHAQILRAPPLRGELPTAQAGAEGQDQATAGTPAAVQEQGRERADGTWVDY